jgi:type I restriction enzyme R subunit
MDRIELGTQSLLQYQGFADENEDVQATENTGVLVTKLKSTDPANTLIVTSIQKMSNIKDEAEGLTAHDVEMMRAKRVVFIVDEAHRSTFGDMLITIKQTFSNALFFGFTGTPIHDENQRQMNTTATVFGDELHRYSIADGIRDKNVLGFDPYKVMTYKDHDLRKAVALEKAKATSEAEALADPKKKEVFNHYMRKVGMAGHLDEAGEYVKGIEDDIPTAQYERIEHQQKVVEDILEHWVTLSQNGKFHAILATSSIKEAIEYYRLIKARSDLNITALFDPNIDNNGNAHDKEAGLLEIVEDYNQTFGQDFTFATHDKFKKDIAARLAHKKPYAQIAKTPEQQINLLIVVDQMLTGFDSKWLNTLYLDKVIKYENIIQAFSRTNRLFGPDKPFGTIRYYRKPHTMEQHIHRAVKLYSGDKPIALFAQRLESNLSKLNAIYEEIAELFTHAGVANFEKLPDDLTERGKFAKLFKALNDYLEAAKIQGFVWSQLSYEFKENKLKTTVTLGFDENIYLILALRYKELYSDGGGGGGGDGVPFEIDGYLTQIDTGLIDADYMNSRFEKYLKSLKSGDGEQAQNTLDELHKSFASLTQQEQKYANVFIHDVQSGNIAIDRNRTFRDYITEYQFTAKDAEIHAIAELFGLDEAKLRAMMNTGITEANINDYGRFDDLKSTVDRIKAKAYFEQLEGATFPAFRINIKVHNVLQAFIISGGFEI